MNATFANANQSNTARQERKGLLIHLIVTLCVCALLTTINLTLCPQFLWFAFPMAGMGIGLAAHYFGVRKHLCAQPSAQN